MAGVFLSYRRDDCPGDVERIYERFQNVFANQYLFLDVKAIKPGTQFDNAIMRRLECSDVLVIAIGPRWLTRLDQPGDFVRLEVSIALANGLEILPLLLRGAAMPKTEQLPADITALARIQAVRIDDAHFDADVGGLVRQVKLHFRIPRSRFRQALLLYPASGAWQWVLRAAMWVAVAFALGWAPGLVAASPEARVFDIVFVVGAFVIAVTLRTWAHHLDVRCPERVTIDY